MFATPDQRNKDQKRAIKNTSHHFASLKMDSSQELDENNVLHELTNSFDSQRSTTSELLSPDKPTNWIQEHYDVENDGNLRKRVCKAAGCSSRYHFGASHQVLRRHWEQKHTGINIKERLAIKFDDVDYIDAMYRWILRGKQAYSTLCDPDFRYFMAKMCPTKPLPNRNRVHDVILDQTIRNQQVIIEKLKEACSVALTFDMWTSRVGYGFGCLTAHYYGKSVSLKSVVLEFKQIPHPHDGPTICAFLKSTLKEYRITRKVVSITTDNASNNISAIDMLVEELKLDSNFSFGFLKFRCTAHILNLAVNKALTELKSLVAGIRNLVLTINGSSKRIQEFKKLQTDLGRQSALKLVEDTPTRWNSTYAMLDRALLLKDAISQAALEMDDLEEIPYINWPQLEDLVKFLGPFNELTTKLSGEKYPSISIVMAANRSLMAHLADEEWIDTTIKQAALAFKVKLEEYEGYLDQPIAVMAAVLDPRLKLDCFDPAAHRFAREMLDTHVRRVDIEPAEAPRSPSFFSRIFVQPSSDEVDAYLMEPRASATCNVSEYWANNADRYPKLSRLARTILNIQATSVACERANSRAGLVDTPHRSSLKDDSIRCNVLLNSWLNLVSPK